MSGVFYFLLRRIRMPLLVLVGVYSVSILGFVLIPGQDDQGNVWQMSFFHAFYFVSFMGSTIGFGEIPYAFTDAQRFWALVAIYGTVVSWLYGIGTMLAIVQDSAFQRLLVESRFKRQVKRITEPFYLICGYGDTGKILTAGLSNEGIGLVVLDINEERINELEASNFLIKPLGLCVDVSRLKYLKMSGLEHPQCQGVIALTNDDQINLTIATAVHLLNRDLRMISRAETTEIEENITSFGANEVINPFNIFSNQLIQLIDRAGMYTLFSWLTSIPDEPLVIPTLPREGAWILCGYGKFGHVIYKKLKDADIDVTVITPNKEEIIHLEKSVHGIGVRASALEKAGVKKAAGIIVGTNNDANNLSIIMTAKELNPNIYIVSRQNQRPHFPIFEAADINLVMQRGNAIAYTIFALVRSPLLGEFIRLAEFQSGEWANKLVSRIAGVIDQEAPSLWEIEIDEKNAPTIYGAIKKRKVVKFKHILRDSKDRELYLNALPLLLYRQGIAYLLPDLDQKLKFGDRILFCGNSRAKYQHRWMLYDRSVFHYIRTGEECSGGYVWQRVEKWLEERKINKKK